MHISNTIQIPNTSSHISHAWKGFNVATGVALRGNPRLGAAKKNYWIYAITDAIIARCGHGFTSTWASWILEPWLIVDDWTATGTELANILLFTASLMAWPSKEYYSKPVVANKTHREWTAWKPVSERVSAQHCPPPTSSSSSSSSSDGRSVSGTKPVPLRTWLWENGMTKWSYVDSWFLIQIRHGMSDWTSCAPKNGRTCHVLKLRNNWYSFTKAMIYEGKYNIFTT